MSRLRVFKANGGRIYDLMLEKEKREQKEKRIVKLEEKMTKTISKKVKVLEIIYNIPVIEKGKKTYIREIFKKIRYA